MERGGDDGDCHSAPCRTGRGSVPLSFGLDYNGKAQVSPAKIERVSAKRWSCLAYSLVKERGDINGRVQWKALYDRPLCLEDANSDGTS